MLAAAGPSAPPIAAEPQPVPPAPSQPPNSPSAEQGAPGNRFGINWGLAPIRWWGLLTTDIRSFSASDQPRILHRVETGQVNVASYVWQPWFAQVSGGIGGSISSQSGSGKSTGTTGHGQVSVFPGSRFPFQASFNVSDSRTSDTFTGQDYRNYRYGVRQGYRPEAGRWFSNASYDRSTLKGSSFGTDTVDALNGQFSQTFDSQKVDLNATHTRNARSESGQRSQFTTLFGNHSYNNLKNDDVDWLLTADSIASFGTTDFRLPTNGTLSTARTDALQLSSFLTWRPEEDHPLFVSGGARWSDTGSSTEASDFQTRILTAYGSASYRVNTNLSLNGGGSVAQISATQGVTGVSTNQFAGVLYNFDPRRFGEYVYTASTSANLSNNTAPETTSRLVTTAQGTHGLQRPFAIGENQSLTFGVSQSVAATQDSGTGSLYTLGHNASGAWSVRASQSMSGFASVSIGDSRSYGYSESEFQLVNLQLSGQAQIDRFSSMTANFTVQGTRQALDRQPADGFAVTSNGGVSYQHARAFGMPRLRYSATYNRSDSLRDRRFFGDVDAPREQALWSFEQRLEYAIGKVTASLQWRLAESDGKKNALVFFRLARQIGDW